MNRSKLTSVPVALAALFGCAGPLQWHAACGCAEVWTGVVGDVGVMWTDIQAEDVTPQFLAGKALSRLKGKQLNLETVRSVGPFFGNACLEVLVETRCVFWMWTSGEHDIRGVELRFAADESGRIAGVEGRYVYDKRIANRG